MSLPGSLKQDELDFPKTIRDSVTTLPFHSGGTITLTAGEASNLFRVKDLRRFENSDAVVRGSHTGSANAVVLTDSDASFLEDGIEVGDELENTTASTSGTVTAVTDTTLTTDGQTWAANANYVVNKRVAFKNARAIEVRKFSITTDLSIYIRLDGTPDATDGFDIELGADESYFADSIRVVGRVSVKGVSATETPKVRWTAWGV